MIIWIPRSPAGFVINLTDRTFITEPPNNTRTVDEVETENRAVVPVDINRRVRISDYQDVTAEIHGITITPDDIVAPIITLTGTSPQIIELGDGYTELGASTDDGSPIVIDSTAFIDAVGTYLITYNSTDLVGNIAIPVTRTVNVVDTTPPIITLIGANPQIIELGDGYTELGATTDDGSAVTISSGDFVDAVGTYQIFYNSTDVERNPAAQVIRTVEVVDTSPPAP